MKTIYLHIGQTKTATTTLQAFFSDNRNWLESKGVLYPHVPEGTANNRQHRFLVESLHRNSDNFTLALSNWDFILDQINTSSLDKIIISEEVFWHLFEQNPNKRREAIRWINQVLSKYDVKIICYLRRQDFWIESWYNQLVKTDIHSLSCMESEDFVNFYRNNGLLNYYQILTEWSSAFGRENMLIRPFEKKQFLNNDLFQDFLSFLSIDNLDGTIRPTQKQKALINPACAFSLVYNRVDNSKRFKSRITDTMKKLSNDQKDLRKQVSEEVARKILHEYAQTNKKIAEEFLNKKTLFLSNDLDVEYMEYQGINAKELAEIVSYLYVEQKSQIARLQKRINILEKDAEKLSSGLN